MIRWWEGDFATAIETTVKSAVWAFPVNLIAEARLPNVRVASLASDHISEGEICA
jgi:hypothetical protein